MAKQRTNSIKHAITRLQDYEDQNQLIAINWWIADDFPDLKDTEQAIELAQSYLDNLNPDLTQYVDFEYEGDREEDE